MYPISYARPGSKFLVLYRRDRNFHRKILNVKTATSFHHIQRAAASNILLAGCIVTPSTPPHAIFVSSPINHILEPISKAYEPPFFNTNFPSFFSTYSTKSSIVHTFNPYFFPKARHPSLLIILVSFLSALPSTSPPTSTISLITPTSLMPASLQNSVAASVCPLLCLMPPSFAISGKT